jgi:hypothetical protein
VWELPGTAPDHTAHALFAGHARVSPRQQRGRCRSRRVARPRRVHSPGTPGAPAGPRPAGITMRTPAPRPPVLGGRAGELRQVRPGATAVRGRPAPPSPSPSRGRPAPRRRRRGGGCAPIEAAGPSASRWRPGWPGCRKVGTLGGREAGEPGPMPARAIRASEAGCRPKSAPAAGVAGEGLYEPADGGNGDRSLGDDAVLTVRGAGGCRAALPPAGPIRPGWGARTARRRNRARDSYARSRRRTGDARDRAGAWGRWPRRSRMRNHPRLAPHSNEFRPAGVSRLTS